MAIPMMLGMSVNMIYNLTDTFFIGKLNDTQVLAAISLLLPFATFLMAIGNLFGTGGSTLFSRLLGSKNQYRAKRCASTTIWLSMIAGIICAVISVIYYIICIQREGKQLSVSFADFKIELAMLKDIFSVGFSAMILDGLLIISSLMFNYYAMKYGDYVLAAFILKVQLCSSFFAAGAGLLTGTFQVEGKGIPAVIMSVVRGLILIPAIIVGNLLFQLNGVIFSLLVSEAVSCIPECVIYYLIRNK